MGVSHPGPRVRPRGCVRACTRSSTRAGAPVRACAFRARVRLCALLIRARAPVRASYPRACACARFLSARVRSFRRLGGGVGGGVAVVCRVAVLGCAGFRCLPLLPRWRGVRWCGGAVAVVLGASLFCLSLPLAGCCCIPLLLWVLALASFRSLYRSLYRSLSLSASFRLSHASLIY